MKRRKNVPWKLNSFLGYASTSVAVAPRLAYRSLYVHPKPKRCVVLPRRTSRPSVFFLLGACASPGATAPLSERRSTLANATGRGKRDAEKILCHAFVYVRRGVRLHAGACFSITLSLKDYPSTIATLDASVRCPFRRSTRCPAQITGSEIGLLFTRDKSR